MESHKQALAQLSQECARYSKLKAMLESLRAEEQALAEQEAALRAALQKEDADVVRLEKTSAAALFYTILGKKDEKLEQEQREAYAARLKYDALAAQLDDCRSRIRQLSSEQAALSGCEARYQAAFRQLQEALKASPLHGAEICALQQSIGENAAQRKEIQEALAAGSAVMNQIETILESLSSAEGWGTWDLLGGGMLSTMAKHSHMDTAQAGAEYLQVLLSRFHTELADVQLTAQTGQVNIDGFLRFADYFFDGLIADWSVLNRIHDSQASVYQVKEQVAQAMCQLESLRDARAAEQRRLEERLAALVHSA